jgi:hypothetical protein
MNRPTVKKPTKKALHFPKTAESNGATDDTEAAAVPAVEAGQVNGKVASGKVGSGKVSRRKRSVDLEAKPAAASAEEKAKRVKKEKVVRDSFTMPKSDYAKIAILKQKCIDAGVSVKKSELLRAGLLLLASAPSKRLLAAVSAVEAVKTGRPAKQLPVDKNA